MFTEPLGRLACALAQAHLPYIVIGDRAALLYGEPRLTRDIDITLGIDVDHQAEVIGATPSLGITPLVDPHSFTRKTTGLPSLDSATGIRVDFIFSFTSYEPQAFDRAARISIGNTHVQFATPEDLIVHKMLAARPRDHEDVTGILMKQPNLGLAYIRDWLAQFSATTSQPIVEQFETLLKNLQ